MRKYLTEFIGTFFLMLTIVAAVGGGLGNFAPLAIGTALVALVYSGGHISDAHYNPAVTIAACLRGSATWKEAPGYIIAQFGATILAAFIGEYLVGHIDGAKGLAAGAPFDFVAGTLSEFLGTFLLVWVILNVATAKTTAGNPYYGIAIGFTVMGSAYALGGVSGGAFNPAVVAGLVAAGMTSASNVAGFLAGQFLGAIAATYAFKYVNRVE